jgi:hypothetical protein
MKRTINSTGRKRISHERINIRLTDAKPGTAPSFSMTLIDLSDLKLNPDARIFVEAYVASSMMRFSFGSVSLFEPPTDTTLTEIDAGSRPLFRIKIVEASAEGGRILAAANEISPRGPGDEDGRKPLLPLRQTDLGQALWTLQVSRDSGPEILVNNRVPGLSDKIVSDPLMQGLVLPAAIAQVFEHLFDPDEDAEWQEDWRTFASGLEGEPIDWEKDRQESDEEIEVLAQRLARAFCERNLYVTRTIELAGALQNE